MSSTEAKQFKKIEELNPAKYLTSYWAKSPLPPNIQSWQGDIRGQEVKISTCLFAINFG